MTPRASARHHIGSQLPAPARLLLQSAGAVFIAWALAACGGDTGGEDRGPRVLELDSTRIELPDSIRMVVVALDHALPADIDPARADVRAGDLVRFEARDGGGHALGFDGAALSPEQRSFLESSGQMRSPPLVAAGNAWVISFAGAPPGEYPYSCVTHGGRGAIAVGTRTATR